jgi:type III secretion protein V
MPFFAFYVLAFLLAVGGMIGIMRPAAEAEMTRRAAEQETKNARIVDLTSFAATRPFMVRFSNSFRGSAVASAISSAVRVMRNGVIEYKGIPDLQPIDFEFHPGLASGRVQFLMSEVPLIDVEVRPGTVAVVESIDRMLELGFQAVEENVPGTRRRRVWVPDTEEVRLKELGIRFMRWEEVFAADVEVEMLRNCPMFVGVHEVQRFMRWADRRYPELGKEVAKTVTLPRLADVCARLTREGVSLRNARLLLETVLEWAPKERDPDIIADHVRLAFKRQLCHEVQRDGLIEVVLLAPELEEKLREVMRTTSQGTYLDLDPETEQTFLDRLGELAGTGGTPALPPVLVTAADIRRSVRKLIEEEFFSVPVFAFSELTQHARVQPVGMIEV